MTAPNTSAGTLPGQDQNYPAKPASAAHIREERADLEKLGDALGCKTVLVAQDGRAPFLDVLRPAHIDARATRVRAQVDYFQGRPGTPSPPASQSAPPSPSSPASLGISGGQP